MKPQKQKGCGKMLCNPKSHNPKTCKQESHVCGHIRLCDSCSGNHTRQEARIKLGDSGFESRPAEDFDLSEKIDEVKKSDGTHNITDFEEIEEHVKTFIRRLKDKLNNFNEIIQGDKWTQKVIKAVIVEIDKLAGEKLK